MHPLRKEASWSDISCIFTPCCPKKKMSFEKTLKLCFYQELGLSFNKENENVTEPFLILGYGLNAYFDVFEGLAKMFLMISIFAIPYFLIYSSHGHY